MKTTITVKQFTNTIQFMFEKRGYTTLENDETVITFEAPEDSKFAGHLIHFPLNVCFCHGIKFSIAPLIGSKVKTKTIEKEIKNILNIAFN